MKFNYQARNQKGEIEAGSIEASSKEAAVSLLRRRDIFVTFLEREQIPVYARKITLFERVTTQDLSLFSRQLAIMFKSKVPLIESLESLAVQMGNINFREKILKMSEKIEGGMAFSQALSLYPKLFSNFYIAMIKSGEVSGKLSEVLDYLAEHLEREHHLSAKTKGALIYPSLVLFVILLVVVLLIVVVIPNLQDILTASGQELPLPTKIVIGISDFFVAWGWLVLLGVILIIFGVLKYYSTTEGKAFFDRNFLKVPILNKTLKMVYLSRFAENISTLILSGLPIAQALEIVADIIGNAAYQEIILKARDEVRKGEMISSVLNKYSDFFPPVFVQMVLVGEKTGTLDTTLMNLISFYQQEVDRTVDSLLRLMEPILIVFMGFVVGGVMISILLPIYQSISL